MKVLVAEDDRDLLDLLSYWFGRGGYTLVPATDGEQAVQRWRTHEPDLLLLDINLPKLNGFEVCRRVREDSATPVIMLSARTDEADILRAFQLGADDYVTKPFSPKQLQARMQAVLRRTQSDKYTQVVSTLRVGDLELDVQTYAVTMAGESTQLTPLEFRILFMLAMNAGRLVPYARLVEYAWRFDPELDGQDANLLKSHVSHIRRKLGLPNQQQLDIQAVSRVGYRLTKS